MTNNENLQFFFEQSVKKIEDKFKARIDYRILKSENLVEIKRSGIENESLSISLPAYPTQNGLEKEYVGVYFSMNIPILFEINLLVKYDNSKHIFEIHREYPYNELILSEYSNSSASILSSIILETMVSIFINVLSSKNKVVAQLISEKYKIINEQVHFELLKNVQGPTKLNDYLVFDSSTTNTIFIDDFSGTNATSASVNIQRIIELYKQDEKNETISTIKSSYWNLLLNIFSSNKVPPQVHKKEVQSPIKEFAIIFGNVNNDGLVIVEQKTENIYHIPKMEVLAKMKQVVESLNQIKFRF